MKKIVWIFYSIVSTTVSFAQPASEIFLFEVTEKRGRLVLTNPTNITNHKGYDNQPYFHPDLPFLYYSSADEDGRTDIVQYNYKTNQSSRITKTHDREYSPKVAPRGNFISCILQRDNGAQDLVEYPIGGGEPTVLVDNLIVGYHAWGSADKLFVFTLPEPFKLHLLDLATKGDTVVAVNIGRSLHTIPAEDAISYTQKISDMEWRIVKLSFKTLASEILVDKLSGKEPDMCWTPDRRILRTEGKKIYLSGGKKSDWTEVDIKSKIPMNSFTRLAMSPDGQRLAVVVSEEK